MYLEIITPDEILFEGKISSITVPGKSGSFQILENHAPIVSSLNTGTVSVKGEFHQKRMNEKFNFINNNTFEIRLKNKEYFLETKKFRILYKKAFRNDYPIYYMTLIHIS